MSRHHVQRRVILTSLAALPAVGSVGALLPGLTANPSRHVRLSDYGGSVDRDDNSEAMRTALAALGPEGGVVEIGAGDLRFASETLGQSGINLPARSVIRGAGRSSTVLRITGRSSCNLFIASNCGEIGLEDMTLMGNSVSAAGESVYGNGGAIRVVLTRGATRSISGVRFRRLHLENFRGPWWVDVSNEVGTTEKFEINDVLVDDVTFTSHPGNSIAPNDVRYNAAMLCIGGHSGAITGIRVRRVSGDATHIKSGVILYHAVADALLEDIRIDNAGREGAADDSGAYAIQIYDSHGLMTGITLDRPIVRAPRSVGIYVAGGRNVTINDPQIFDQSDGENTTLQKAAIVFNGTRHWRVSGGTLGRNWRDIDVLMPPIEADKSREAVSTLNELRSDRSREGILIRPMAGQICGGVRIANCEFRTRERTVLVQNQPGSPKGGARPSGGYVNDVQFERCQFEADGNFRALDLWGGSGSPAGGYTIAECRLVGTNPLYARDQQGSITVTGCDISDRGLLAGSAAASLIGCARLDVSDTRLESPGPGGIGINLAGSHGGVRSLRFADCTHMLAPALDPPQLGRGRPRFVGDDRQVVENLERKVGEPAAWISQGASGWRAITALQPINR